jgi:hypothetical protein
MEYDRSNASTSARSAWVRSRSRTSGNDPAKVCGAHGPYQSITLRHLVHVHNESRSNSASRDQDATCSELRRSAVATRQASPGHKPKHLFMKHHQQDDPPTAGPGISRVVEPTNIQAKIRDLNPQKLFNNRPRRKRNRHRRCHQNNSVTGRRQTAGFARQEWFSSNGVTLPPKLSNPNSVQNRLGASHEKIHLKTWSLSKT